MSDKRLGLVAFAGTGFDMEATSIINGEIHTTIGHLIEVQDVGKKQGFIVRDAHFIGNDRLYDQCRPRLSKPQVLDDYSKVLIDGLVWNCMTLQHDYSLVADEEWRQLKSGEVRILEYENSPYEYRDIIWLECIGAEPEYADHARELGIPVIGGEE